MSLKAKIEAVIYASEEPVTLVQLAGLLGLEAQGELDALRARQHRLELVAAGGDGDADEAEAGSASIEPETAVEAKNDAAAGEPENAAANEGAAAEPDAISEPEAESAGEKRRARERERRVREYLSEMVAQLIADYATSERGLEVREVAGGYRMATKPEYHDAVRGFVKSLETAVEAYAAGARDIGGGGL